MWRNVLGTAAGAVVGVALTVLLLRVTSAFLAWKTAPRLFEMEHDVIYLTLVLGGGFGATCGTLTGITAAILREWRRKSSS